MTSDSLSDVTARYDHLHRHYHHLLSDTPQSTSILQVTKKAFRGWVGRKEKEDLTETFAHSR
jgi:hypothetical protein